MNPIFQSFPELELDTLEKYRRSKRDIVIEAIRERFAAGKPLNPFAVKREDPHLFNAILGQFRPHKGGWEAALHAAGLNPDDHFLIPRRVRRKLGRHVDVPASNYHLANHVTFKTQPSGEVYLMWQRMEKALDVEIQFAKSQRPVWKNGNVLIASRKATIYLDNPPWAVQEGDRIDVQEFGTSTQFRVVAVEGDRVIAELTKGLMREWKAPDILLSSDTTSLEKQRDIVKEILAKLEQRMQSGARTTAISAAPVIEKAFDTLLALKPPPDTTFDEIKAQSLEGKEDEGVRLDPSQSLAVQMALNPINPVTVIWGPPGTGKTEVIAQIAAQFAAQGKKVLIASQMNQAVDVALERLLDQRGKAPVLRVANRADAIQSERVRETWIGDDAYRRQTVFHYMDHPQQGLIMGATAMGIALSHALRGLPRHMQEFDVVILDEASRATWPEAAACLMLAKKKIVIVGDPRQLPPVVDRDAARVIAAQGLPAQEVYRGMMDDMVDRGFDQVMLSTNHRSHPLIAGLISTLFYEGRIDERDIEEEAIVPDNVKLIDTSKESHPSHEMVGGKGEIFNIREVEIVVQEIRRLLHEGLAPEEISVVTPYAAQVALIRRELKSGRVGLSAQQIAVLSGNVNTVDSFQGGENRATIVSFVRSNKDRPNVGFLKDLRRLNVALSRAQERLIIIGDMDTLKNTQHEPADLAVGRLFTALEKYHEEIVKPAVAAVKEAQKKRAAEEAEKARALLEQAA